MVNSCSITDIKGIRIGHATNRKALTGCTVILAEGGAVCGVDVSGSAPGIREHINSVHAIVLSGGSAFGLATADGVMRFLEERKIGYGTGNVIVPIVSASVIFDLNTGNPNLRPDAEMGYKACLNATDNEVEEGNVGAGTGAAVGKSYGMKQAMKGGLGTACLRTGDGILVGALVVVNAIGNVIDQNTGKTIAGVRSPDGHGFIDALKMFSTDLKNTLWKFENSTENTTIGVVVTNAKFNQGEMNKIARMAQDGVARCVNPVHTTHDGDTIYSLSIPEGDLRKEVSAVGTLAAQVISEAIISAIKQAKGVEGLPSWSDITN